MTSFFVTVFQKKGLGMNKKRTLWTRILLLLPISLYGAADEIDPELLRIHDQQNDSYLITSDTVLIDQQLKNSIDAYRQQTPSKHFDSLALALQNQTITQMSVKPKNNYAVLTLKNNTPQQVAIRFIPLEEWRAFTTSVQQQAQRPVAQAPQQQPVQSAQGQPAMGQGLTRTQQPQAGQFAQPLSPQTIQQQRQNTGTKQEPEKTDAEKKLEAMTAEKAKSDQEKTKEALKKMEEEKKTGGESKGSGVGAGGKGQGMPMGKQSGGQFDQNQHYRHPQQQFPNKFHHAPQQPHKPLIAMDKIGFEGNKMQSSQIAKTPDASLEAIEALKSRGAVVATLPDAQFQDEIVEIPLIKADEFQLDHDKRSDPNIKKEKIIIYRPEDSESLDTEALHEAIAQDIKNTPQDTGWFTSLYQKLTDTLHSWFTYIQSVLTF